MQQWINLNYTQIKRHSSTLNNVWKVIYESLAAYFLNELVVVTIFS